MAFKYTDPSNREFRNRFGLATSDTRTDAEIAAGALAATDKYINEDYRKNEADFRLAHPDSHTLEQKHKQRVSELEANDAKLKIMLEEKDKARREAFKAAYPQNREYIRIDKKTGEPAKYADGSAIGVFDPYKEYPFDAEINKKFNGNNSLDRSNESIDVRSPAGHFVSVGSSNSLDFLEEEEKKKKGGAALAPGEIPASVIKGQYHLAESIKFFKEHEKDAKAFAKDLVENDFNKSKNPDKERVSSLMTDAYSKSPSLIANTTQFDAIASKRESAFREAMDAGMLDGEAGTKTLQQLTKSINSVEKQLAGLNKDHPNYENVKANLENELRREKDFRGDLTERRADIARGKQAEKKEIHGAEPEAPAKEALTASAEPAAEKTDKVTKSNVTDALSGFVSNDLTRLIASMAGINVDELNKSAAGFISNLARPAGEVTTEREASNSREVLAMTDVAKITSQKREV